MLEFLFFSLILVCSISACLKLPSLFIFHIAATVFVFAISPIPQSLFDIFALISIIFMTVSFSLLILDALQSMFLTGNDVLLS
jgi:hypothetical protein